MFVFYFLAANFLKNIRNSLLNISLLMFSYRFLAVKEYILGNIEQKWACFLRQKWSVYLE